MLIPLSPENGFEYIAALDTARQWAAKLARFYCDPMQWMVGDDVKLLAVAEDGKTLALIAVRVISNGIYEIHAIAPPNTPRGQWVWLFYALICVRNSLFHSLGARQILTTCATYRGHAHKGVYRLAVACGMKPNGREYEGETMGGTKTIWREYAITREQYYGRT